MLPSWEFRLVWQGWSSQSTWNWKMMENGTVLARTALIRLPSQAGTTGLDLFCRRARFAFVSFRPVVLDLGV